MNAIATYVKKGDIRVFNFFNQRINCTFLDKIMTKITHLGSLAFSIILPVLLFFMRKQSLKSAGLHIAITLVLSTLIVQTIKRVVDRPRPFKVLDCKTPGKVPACRYSFPSGHSCAAFSAAFVLAALYASFSAIFLILAGLVAISRVYLGYHYPTDILVGSGIAYLSYFINFIVF